MLETARKNGRQIIQESVPPALWQQNGEFCQRLREMIEAHPMGHHPLIQAMDSASIGAAAQRVLHLEFRYAFSDIFTDALIMAMFRTAELEPRLGAVAKIAGRFLIQLNVLDELGFVPNGSTLADYAGNPFRAHLLEFDGTLHQLGVSQQEIDTYRPSPAAIASRRTFEDAYDDLTRLAATLCAAETVFVHFTVAWSRNVHQRTTVDTEHGYHSIHIDHEGEFLDDDHSEDMWFVLRQSLVPERYAEIQAHILRSLDTWTGFIDHFMAGAVMPTDVVTSAH
jgi:pyrroloquinoline quinone (PQQ) biosynthesis protein C